MGRYRLTRRGFLQTSALLAASTTLPRSVLSGDVAPPATTGAVFYLPGYRPQRARYGGIPLSHHPDFTEGIPAGYEGPRTMVSRLTWNGTVKRRVFPLKGHQITVDRRFPLALFNSIDHPAMVTFDRHSLALDRRLEPHAEGFVGGGHALFTPDGCCLAVLERREMRPFTGRAEDHYGAIVLRDPISMQVMTVHSCHGVNPHEIRMVDDHTVAISNYGSAGWPVEREQRPDPFVVEPSITLVDLRNGALVEKYVGLDPQLEIRHLAVDGRGGLLAIQTRLVPAREEPRLAGGSGRLYEADDTVDYRLWFAPAPLYSISAGERSPVPLADPMDQRQGQSILYDPRHDEFIVTYTSSHRVAVIDGTRRRVKRVIETDRLGLHYPRGLQPLPDTGLYAVSGSWRNIHLFERGTHRPVPQGVRYETWFGHSHMSVI